MWLLRILKLAAILTPLVPATIGYRLCQILGVMFYLVNHRARNNIQSNLQNIERDSRAISRLITGTRVCMTIVTNYYDLLRLRLVDRDSILQLVDIDGLDNFEEALDRGRGVIILSGHIGNFSVMARLPAALGYQASIIAEEVSPPALFHYMTRLRSAMGIRVIPPGTAAVKEVIRLLRSNGILLVAGDRDLPGNGLNVHFFSKLTTIPFGPVLLAMRTGATIIPAYTHRTGLHHSRVVLEQPLELVESGDWDKDLQTNVQAMARRLERMIARDAGQWAVLQRVWPPVSHYGRSEGIGSVDEFLDQNSSNNVDADEFRRDRRVS